MLLFADVCLLLDRISAVKPVQAGEVADGSNTSLAVFKSWLDHLTGATPTDGLLLFRLLFPEHDTRRRYGLQETLLARELVAALSLSQSASRDLYAWREDASRAGCLGKTVHSALAVRRVNCVETSVSLPLNRLDELLDELACLCSFSCAEVRSRLTRTPPPRSRRAILFDLFSPLSATEACYLVQIILRDLSPLLYPIPSTSADVALTRWNANAYQPLDLVDALREWHWILPSVYRYRMDLDVAFTLLKQHNIKPSEG